MENKIEETLSADLIIEIISRLPVKDLMRFKCVSKSWLSLISSDSHLSRLQLERVASSSDLPFVVLRIPHSRMDDHGAVNPEELLFYNYWFDLESCVDHSNDLKGIRNPFDRNDPDNADAVIVASCDGLLVLRQSKTRSMALLNPSTGKYLVLPPNPAGNQNVHFLGFGYDRHRECYKLVTLVSPPKPDHSFDLMIYYVNDTWRRVETQFQFDDIDCDLYDNPGVCVNNVLYWHFTYPDYTKGVIFYFDLEEEEFDELKPPDCGYVMCKLAEMVAFDEKLCMVCTWTESDEAWTRVGDEKQRTDIWVLSEAEMCWTKLFSISDPKTQLNFSDDDGENYVLLTLYFYSACRNKVLFYVYYDTLPCADFKTFAWYNLETKEFEKFRDQNYSSYVTCKRSLVGNGMF